MIIVLMVINILRGENCERGLGGWEGWWVWVGGWMIGREEWEGWIYWGLGLIGVD